jgi:hypothetical protein
MFYRKSGAALEKFGEVLGNFVAALTTTVGDLTIYDRQLHNNIMQLLCNFRQSICIIWQTQTNWHYRQQMGIIGQ